MRKLFDEIREAIVTITKMFEKSGSALLEKRDMILDLVAEAARSGLCSSDYDETVGEINLISAKREVEIVFPELRKNLWERYLKYLGIGSCVLFPLGAALYYLSYNGLFGFPKPDGQNVFNPLVAAAIALCWIPVGASLGIFVEYIFRVGDDLPFEKIQTNRGRWEPIQLWLNTVVTAYLFALSMGLGIIQIGLMSVPLNDFITTKPALSLLVGFVTGFAYPYVQDTLKQLRLTTQKARV